MSDESRKVGFAAMTPEQRKEISSKGGRALVAKGVGHKLTSEDCRAGGTTSGRRRSREYMAMLGRRGSKGKGKKKKITIATEPRVE